KPAGGSDKPRMIFHGMIPCHQTHQDRVLTDPKLGAHLTPCLLVRTKHLTIETTGNDDAFCRTVSRLLMLLGAHPAVVDDGFHLSGTKRAESYHLGREPALSSNVVQGLLDVPQNWHPVT